ncbi:flagellar protein FlgJ [Pseudoduganella flava]|uniref:Flagellar assembly peptidoglycan hydrolase FlgJ n=1 Tax=Pseudoduganella flava TaxID=871742 RepID=A0A562Q0P3_9BURK|nr:glucosaminidase domain-containing protein [Pseudoduganella flava]QGZ38442.1 flagellar assembly peptidoglycan hydrolase FlgJ [Pseudoduganella flava]TWI50010.1 flagellar protein FlgJ [Pseudoduganella flava]
MNRPDFTFSTLPTQATAATVSNMTSARPALPAEFSGGGAGAGAGFPAAFRQVQSDVAAFIANGGGTTAPDAATPLTADGAALRARLSATAIGGTTAPEDAAGVDGDAQQQFLASIRPYAEEAGEKLGVSPDIVAAHAALESGWGQRPLKNGTESSNNLFGIKAGSQWQGDVAANVTHEYEHGAAVKKVEKFRSYPDQATAFRDYAELLASNPRYQKALGAGNDAHAFATGLARGGYATDPAYAQKLSKLAAKIARTDY